MKKIKGNLTLHFTVDEYGVNQTETVTISPQAIEHAKMLEEFRTWLGRPMTITSWFRTSAYNKKVGGVSTSSHLEGIATDFAINKKIDEASFIKYAKKWKEICKKHGVVGEAGLYIWGMHLGSHVTYSKTFYHWDSRSGKQKNNPFTI